MKNMPRLHRFAALLALLGPVSLAGAQDAAPPAQPEPTPEDLEKAEQVEQGNDLGFDFASLPPQIRLGVRVALVRKNIPTHRAVVIVPDASVFVEAIAEWTTDARFPILIDDGSDSARENIARFVRAYTPDAVLRWPGTGNMYAQAIEVMQQRIDDALAQSWGAENAEGLWARWQELEFAPMGVVAMSIHDPAWAGGLALAAGHGQPIAWVDAEPQKLGGEIALELAGAIEGAVTTLCQEKELAFLGVGDVIDAYTIAMSVPTKVASPNGPLALTDCLARTEQRVRWGWVGMLPGDAQGSVYRAMCSLYLDPRSAWLVDGYESKPELNTYDVMRAVEIFRRATLNVVTDRPPSVGRNAWRTRAASGVDAGFINVNSSGQRRWFRLLKDDLDAADIPMLRVPAVVHMIHSFSAQNPDDAGSIAARWMDRGAYAYIGSVDEPYLSAFQAPAVLVRRWFQKAPLAIAARYDMVEPWKLNYFGDPLLIYGDLPRHKPGVPALDNAAPLAVELRAAIQERRLPDAARTLVLMGRDADAARLFTTALADPAHKASEDLAAACFFALIRAGDVPGAVAAFESDLRRERQMEGVEKAKAAGKYKGRPASIDPTKVRELHASGMGASQIAKTMKIGRASVYRALAA